MTSNHRVQAERHRETYPFDAEEHLLAAINDGQREQTALLRAILDQMVAGADAADDEEPCGYGCNSISAGCPVHDLTEYQDRINERQDRINETIKNLSAGGPVLIGDLWATARREDFHTRIKALGPDQDVLDALVDVAAVGVPPERLRRLARGWAAGKWTTMPESGSQS